MSIKLGLCGAHRTGKTTLAEALNQQQPMVLVRTNTSEVFRQHGLDPAEPMDFKTRLWIQHKILEAGEALWASEQGSFVTDRTPLDMLAYTLADIQGSSKVHFEDLQKYMQHCFAATNTYFSHLALIQPGIPLIFEEGKAALNRAYIEHLSITIGGLLHDERQQVASYVLPHGVLDLQQRLDSMTQWLNS